MKNARQLAPLIALLACAVGARGESSCPPPPGPTGHVEVAKFGTKGDGVHDDTAAIQAAIDAAPDGGTVHLGPGTYLITVGADPKLGLRLKDHLNLLMDDGAVLKAQPTKSPVSAVLKGWNVSGVRLYGGTILGERDAHEGSGGEWGMGLDLRDARHVLVINLVARRAWGDGFYVGGKNSKDIHFCNVEADGNRRNGMSITGGSDITVLHSRFINTGGTAPQVGIDVEPDKGNTAENILIADSLFKDNLGGGVALETYCRDCGSINRGNVVRNNTFIHNGRYGIYATSENHQLLDNTISDSGQFGIRLLRASAVTVSGNKISGSPSAEIQVDESSSNVIRSNRLAADKGHAVHLINRANANRVEGNVCNAATADILADPDSTGNQPENNSGCR